MCLIWRGCNIQETGNGKGKRKFLKGSRDGRTHDLKVAERGYWELKASTGMGDKGQRQEVRCVGSQLTKIKDV